MGSHDTTFRRENKTVCFRFTPQLQRKRSVFICETDIPYWPTRLWFRALNFWYDDLNQGATYPRLSSFCLNDSALLRTLLYWIYALKNDAKIIKLPRQLHIQHAVTWKTKQTIQQLLTYNFFLRHISDLLLFRNHTFWMTASCSIIPHLLYVKKSVIIWNGYSILTRLWCRTKNF